MQNSSELRRNNVRRGLWLGRFRWGVIVNRAHRRAQKSKKKGNHVRINPRTQKGKLGGYGAVRPASNVQRILGGLDD